jgi:hypothetical protein
MVGQRFWQSVAFAQFHIHLEHVNFVSGLGVFQILNNITIIRHCGASRCPYFLLPLIANQVPRVPNQSVIPLAPKCNIQMMPEPAIMRKE